MPEIDIEAVRLLVSISDLRSFKGAAERHRMTVSNVSNRIRKLERDFGAQVLRRTTRTLELTALGHRLVVLGEAVAKELAVAEMELARIGSQFGGSLTVSVADELISWVTPLILDVAESNPRLRVNLTIDTRAGARPDIRIRRVSKPEIGAVPISMVICQSVGTAIAPRQFSVAELSALPVCTLGHTPIPVRIELRKGRSRFDAEVVPCFVTTDIEVLLAAVANGIGVGLLPELVFNSSVSKSQFKLLLPDHGIELSAEGYQVELSDHARSKAVASYVFGMLEARLTAAIGPHG